MAVMLARGDLALEADIRSDTAVGLGPRRGRCSAAAPGTRWLRDPTRGGVATVCNELAHDTGLGVVLDEPALPVLPVVTGACDLLGIDPLYVANEGKVVAVVAPEEADAALAAMRNHPLGGAAAIIGEIVADPRASSSCARRSAAPGSSTCSWATRSRGSADGRRRWSEHGSASPGRCRESGSGRSSYRHAVALGLAGTVRNDSDGVLIEVEGDEARIAELERLLVDEPPPLARVASLCTPRRSNRSGTLGRLPHRRDRRRRARRTCR